uniref:Cation/H+ exchanger transmembrane domain-containing protein n=1 Tax=Peronospora matthiolae TaxID=2874970 RepID=A0AAV1T7M9_9STRA
MLDSVLARRPLISPHSTLLLLALTLFVATSLPAVTAFPVLRDEIGDNDEVTRRLSGGGGKDKNKTVPFNSWGNTIDTLKYVLAFVIVLVAAHPLGLYFPRLFKLPLITGYLFIGIIAGPFIANLITQEMVSLLASYVSALALSFISFQAGQEIYWPELKPQVKSIMALLGVLYVTAMIILTSATMLTESFFFYDDMGMLCQLGIALMFGSISVLGSPATVMAIKIELNSAGPFTSLMLGATMTAEFIVLISFSIARIICSTYCAKLDVSFLNLMFIMGIVGSNILVGVLLGGVIILIFKIPGGEAHHDGHGEHQEGQVTAGPSDASYLDQRTDAKGAHLNPNMEPGPSDRAGDCTMEELRHTPSPAFLSPQASLGLKGFIWLTMGYMFYVSTSVLAEATAAAFGLSWEIKFEALLVLMIASCVAGHYEPIRHDMHVILDTTAPYMFLPFFVMTGAALKLDQVLAAVPLMTVYVVLRYIAIFIACYFGGRYILKLTPMQYNNLWLTMTPQAGVALGLANEVKAMSDESWAMEFAATIVAAVVVNQIIGPPLCAMGLSRAGETLKDRMLTQADAPKEDMDHMEKSFHGGRSSIVHVNAGFGNSVVQGGGFGNSIHGGGFARGSLYDMGRITMSGTTRCNGDPRSLLPFTKVQNAVVIGDDEVAFEIALELSLYGARVNVPLLDQERTTKWQKMNEAILHRAAKGDLISYKNTLKDRENAQAMSAADVIIFTGDSNRTRENVQMLKSLLGAAHPRMIAFVPDCKFSKEMKAQGVLVIQPSIALANIATRMALLDAKLAEALSNEISTTSDFSTASYFLGGHGGDLADLRLEGRRMALGRNVVNHHSVDYDRLAEALTSENLPMPPPPSRVAMFGTSSASGFDPFQRDTRSGFFVMHEDHDEADEIVLDTHTGSYTTRGNSRLSVQRPSAQLGASRVRGGNVARGKRTPGSNKPRY